MQMLERLSYWSVVLQMPIYIAQKDIAGTLGWSHTEKGIIYFWWALVQNLTPLLSGYLADKYGRKKIFLFSFIITIAGFLSLSLTRDFTPFLFATLLLGFGLGSFKPILQGSIAGELNEKNSSAGWGIYVLMVNLSVFLAPPLSIYLKGISWAWLFWGSAMIFSINFLILPFLKESKVLTSASINIKLFFWTLFKKDILIFIGLMSGFTIIYMQFYETLPNFIFDWVDTSAIARILQLPDFMLMTTPNGKMIAFEWLYNLNTGLIILFVAPMAFLTRRFNILKVISVGILIASVGLGFCGFFYFGSLVLLGFVIYTFGEMITNPKFTEYLGNIAPVGNKSMYLSFLNISWAIGLSLGGLLGGWLYNHYGEKAGLAKRYLLEHYQISDISLQNSFTKLSEMMHIKGMALTNLLRETYFPEQIWIPFIALGILCSVGMYFFGRRR
jgi:MFS family permease